MQERDAVHRPAPSLYLLCTDDFLDLPIAPFYQYIGAAGKDQVQRRIFVEHHHQADGFQRCKHHHAILLAVYRTVIALALPLYRSIAVHAYDERGPQRAGLSKVGHMAAMQHVETAVGEHDGRRQGGYPRRKDVGGANFVFESGGRVHLVQIFKQSDHAPHTFGGAGDIGGGIGLFMFDQAHQIYRAIFGNDFDVIGIEAIVVQKSQFYV
jgi:hypothetical protein